MSTRKLWTLCIVGEQEDGGTPCQSRRVASEIHDDAGLRSEFENIQRTLFEGRHFGHVPVAMWWQYEEMEEK